MDEFEVIYTEEDIIAVQQKLEEQQKKYSLLEKEKEKIDMVASVQREKLKTLNEVQDKLSKAMGELAAQQDKNTELKERQHTLLALQKEQDQKLIRVLKEKHAIQLEVTNRHKISARLPSQAADTFPGKKTITLALCLLQTVIVTAND